MPPARQPPGCLQGRRCGAFVKLAPAAQRLRSCRGGVAAAAASLPRFLRRSTLLLLVFWLHALLPPAPAARAAAPPKHEGDISFTVVITTLGRPTLATMLSSLGPQLSALDNVVVISDINATDPSTAPRIAATEGMLKAMACNCSKLFIQNPAPMGGSGHNSRTHHQKALPGAFVMHADDDDMYTPDAFEIIRAVITDLSPKVYIFRAAKENLYRKVLIPFRQLMSFPAMHSTHPREIGFMNGGTPNGVARNIPSMFPDWGTKIGGDAIFWQALIYNFGFENTVLVPRVIYMVNEYLYGRLHELGVDQPRGFFFSDAQGRPVPDGDFNYSVPMLNGVPMLPNPLLKLRDRYAQGACTSWGFPPSF